MPHTHNLTHHQPRQRGLIMMDAIIGLSTIAILLLALTQATALQRSATAELADQRTATSIATRVLTAMQAGDATPTLDVSVKVSLKKLDDGLAITGQQWVEITVKHRKATATLTGIVPRAAADAFIRSMEARP